MATYRAVRVSWNNVYIFLAFAGVANVFASAFQVPGYARGMMTLGGLMMARGVIWAFRIQRRWEDGV